MTQRLSIERRDLHRTHWDELPPRALADGEVRLRIERIAITANNITYAAFGDAMRYWDFFPTGDAATGCLPVWGFAEVAESRHEAAAPGERLYGYFPLADELIVQPARANAAGFLDGAEHRRALHTLYNHYLRCSADPGYRPDHEAVQALLRPLFTTSFLIDDFLADQGGFGAAQVVLSSASSKTAYGTAFCLAQRRGQPGAMRIVGLTSAAHASFTHSLGCYDAVHAYEALDALDARTPTVYVDFSGSAPLRRAIHERFGERLAYSCSVGGTHWDELAAKGASRDLPGPKPTLFFAPAQASKRIEQWGAAGLQQRLAEAWVAFMQPVTRAEPPWLRVVEHHGLREAEAVYRTLLDGTAAPQDGHIVTLGA
ncbi:MAG: DUF2855 family protein [Burkholderiaceae bacterium]|nr:MAG: DUF2855 family protein [Burkholderiaceae bacterium]